MSLHERFRQAIESKKEYFLGWDKKYFIDEDLDEFYTQPQFEGFEFTKGDSKIKIEIDCQGWTPLLVFEKGNEKLISFGYGECYLAKDFYEANIRKRVKKVYNSKQKYDRKTKLFLDDNPKIIDVYIDILVELGILKH